jgi:hypothetical protein
MIRHGWLGNKTRYGSVIALAQAEASPFRVGGKVASKLG